MFNIPHGGDLLGAVVGCLGFVVGNLIAGFVLNRTGSVRRGILVLILSYILAVLFCYWLNTVWS